MPVRIRILQVAMTKKYHVLTSFAALVLPFQVFRRLQQAERAPGEPDGQPLPGPGGPELRLVQAARLPVAQALREDAGAAGAGAHAARRRGGQGGGGAAAAQQANISKEEQDEGSYVRAQRNPFLA